jgi:hypothetical protein
MQKLLRVVLRNNLFSFLMTSTTEKTSVAQKAIKSMAVSRVCRRELTKTMAGLVGE